MEQFDIEQDETLITAVVDTDTNEFVELGAVPDDRYIKVFVPRNPDPVRECWSGNTDNPIKPKDAAAVTKSLQQQSHDAIPLPIRAVLIHALGAKPSEDAIAAAFTAYLDVLKGLS